MKRGALIIMLIVGVGAMAQSQAPAPPVAGTVQDQPTTPTYEPSDRPLSGIQTQDIGTSSESRNTFVPSISVATGWDSNAPRVGTSSTEESSGITTLSGSLKLNHDTGKNATSLGYTGGGQIYTLDSNLDSQFHRLDFSQNIVAGRWSLLVADGFSYQKDAFISLPGLLFPGSIPGLGGTGFKPGVGPEESIIGQNIPRINNTSSGEVTYGFSRATTLTTNVSYGVLHYFEDSDLLSSRQISAGTGLDHRFGRDSVGVNYSFARYSYDNLAEKFDSHTIQFLYSHVLTGRWSFEAGGGPSIVVSNFGLLDTTKVYGSGQVAFRYHMPLTDLSLRYGRSVTNGSGALPGAITDDLGFAGTRRLSQSTSVNLSGGYARNAGAFVNSSFNTFYVGAGISQSLGRYASVSFGYTGERQTGSSVEGLTRHAVMVTFNWSFRPVVLR